MTIQLNHTIVPAVDSEASAQWYADLLGLEYTGKLGHFAPIQLAEQGLTLDFDTREAFQTQHYAFKVSEAEFDEVFGRVQALDLKYGSGPFSAEDGEINHWNGGRGVYFRDPNGHLLELLTRDYTAEQFS